MFNKMKYQLARFMFGRYGVDELSRTSLIILIIVQLFQLFIQHPLLNSLVLLMIVWLFYRMFSKNILARQKENQRFLTFTRSVKTKWKLFIRRMTDIKTHRYRQCTTCKTILRLPRKRGRHKTRCPKCSHSFDVTIWI